MQCVMPERLTLLLAALIGLATAAPSRAAPPDQATLMPFAESPVTVTAARTGGQTVSLHIQMKDGQCRVSRETLDGRSIDLFTMAGGAWGGHLDAGETLRLDPQGHQGEYSVRLIPETLANLRGFLISSLGMMLVGVVAVFGWRRISHAQFRWFWIGAGLWTVAVAVKVGCAVAGNAATIGFLEGHLPYPLFVAAGGLFVGIESSLCEMGFTLLAVWLWRPLGRDAGRAIAVGIGAGAIEAFLLGAALLVSIVIVVAGLPPAGTIAPQLITTADTTRLFWLIGPVERVLAVLCHASSRALILLGVTHRRWAMALWGLAIFTVMDAIAGAAHVSGRLGTFSVWWIELAILPIALVSVPVLRACYRRWSERGVAPGLEQAAVC